MFCEVNGTNLYYEKTGEGSPLIMLHGNGEDCKIFDRAIPLLAKRFTVYAIDSRGHGRSQAVTTFSYDDMAEDVRCFIKAQELDKPVLYGFSDGGIIALLLASSYPDLLSQIIISGANTVPTGVRDKWLKFFQKLNERVHDPKIEMMLNEPNISPEMLKKIQIPALVLAGSHDMIKREHTQYIADTIPNSTMKIIRFAGHGSYVVHRKKIAELILEFVGA